MRGEVGQNRRLHFALAASLALHAAVFLAVSERRHPARPAEPLPGPIEARLAEPPPAVEPEASPAIRPQKSKPAVKPETRPAAVAPEVPQAVPEPASAVEASPAATLGQDRLQVIGAARAFNRYPPLARENNWEGTVEVLLRIRGDGTLGTLSVKTSSGRSVLDKQALDMFRQAQQAVPVPAALRGKAITLELTAIYRLRDQDSD